MYNVKLKCKTSINLIRKHSNAPWPPFISLSAQRTYNPARKQGISFSNNKKNKNRKDGEKKNLKKKDIKKIERPIEGTIGRKKTGSKKEWKEEEKEVEEEEEEEEKGHRKEK